MMRGMALAFFAGAAIAASKTAFRCSDVTDGSDDNIAASAVLVVSSMTFSLSSSPRRPDDHREGARDADGGV
jgi:hypothetical protein